MLKAIDLFTQNSIMVKVNEKTIYFDPYDFEQDLVLLNNRFSYYIYI